MEGTKPRYPLELQEGEGEDRDPLERGLERGSDQSDHPDKAPPPHPTEKLGKVEWARSKVRGCVPGNMCMLGAERKTGLGDIRGEWGRAHHTDEIPAAVLSHQLLLAAATLDDAAQPPIEHNVGAVGAITLPGVGGGSYRVRHGPRQGLSVEVGWGLHLYSARPASTAVQSIAKSIWRTKGDILAATVCAALSTTLGCARMIL